MAVDHALKRAFSRTLNAAHLHDLPEKFIGKRFLFAYELNGQVGLLCGEIRGIEFSMAVGLHLFVSSPALETFRLKSLYWNPGTNGWNAIVEVERVDLLLHFAQGNSGLAPNIVPGQLEIVI